MDPSLEAKGILMVSGNIEKAEFETTRCKMPEAIGQCIPFTTMPQGISVGSLEEELMLSIKVLRDEAKCSHLSQGRAHCQHSYPNQTGLTCLKESA